MLHVHRAERADALIAMLGDLVLTPLPDPVTPEIVSVPSRGVERWVTQQLATRLGARPGHGDGVSANIDFPFPGALVGRALAAVSEMAPDADPWSPDRSVWPLIEVVDANLDEPWLAPLGGTRRFAAIRHVADLFDRYGVHRPGMIRAWRDGDDCDATGEPLPDDVRWQPALWRRLRRQIDVPSLAERLLTACTAIREEPGNVGLPNRISLFGLTRLPRSYLDVLAAIAAARDVHLFLLHPSPELWATIAGTRSTGSRRAEDSTAGLVRNPLLASWGRDAREMQLVIAGSPAPIIDDHRDIHQDRGTILARLQADIRADRVPPGLPLPGRPDGPAIDGRAIDGRAVLDADDRSIQVHSCHGRGRQVEVVRDAILHLLADDATLEPRDVIVMCPDIETYAPLIHATFGAGRDEEEDAADTGLPELRVRLADRALRQTNPILGVVATLLDLAASRVTASEIIDLAGRPPVRRRFDLDANDLTRLAQWISTAGVRWGLDGERRKEFGLGGLETGTWKFGLDRTLLGVTMADEDERTLHGVVPMGDVDSGEIELAGSYAEMVARVDEALASFRGEKTLAAWADAIATAVDSLCATSQRDAWQRAQLQYLLDDVVGEATGGEATGGEATGGEATGSGVTLVLGEVTSLLADRLRGRPTRANFRTGQLTICTLVPMRSVPHRVVCLLGLDDGVFPRAGERDGDDLVLADPHVGDRDARSEDRQLLLDALLAATDHLVVTYTGRDERTNLERPPAVPVGELLDVIDRTACMAGGGSARRQVVVHHPLQPFDARNFRPGALIDEPWSFDRTNLEGALACEGPRVLAGAFLDRPLPEPGGGAIELALLERFVRHPGRTLLRERFSVFLGDRETEIDDAIPVDLDALEKWGVGERLLAARLAGVPRSQCLEAELARGMLPPGGLGRPVIDEITNTVEEIVAATDVLVPGARVPDSLDVHVGLRSGTLTGVVPGVVGDVVWTSTYSRVGPAARLIAWVRLLAVSAAYPERSFTAVTVGKAVTGKKGCAVARIEALGADAATRKAQAVAELDHLVDLVHRGLREPVPLACKTSAAWVADHDKAADVWDGGWQRPGEADDPEHRLLFGGSTTFDDLLGERPLDDEAGSGWATDEPSRFGRWARALWEPLLARETVKKA